MAVPVVLGAGAAAAAGAAMLAGAAGAATTWILEHAMATLTPAGVPATSPQISPINNAITINNVLPPQQVGVVNEMVMNETVGGAEVGRIGIVPKSMVTAEVESTTAEDMNTLHGTEEGRSGFRDLPASVRNAQPTAANDAAATVGGPVTQSALRGMARRQQNPALGPDLLPGFRRSQRSDGSRTSLEYHEWKFCCVDPGKHNQLFFENEVKDGSYPFQYADTDGIGPFKAPPYYIWIKHEDYRKLINLSKRFGRLRGACGGKALWINQGFASKELAIVDDIVNSSEAQTLMTNLLATGDFVIIV